MNGGRAANVVSDYAEAMLMFRVVGSCEEILKQVRKLVRRKKEKCKKEKLANCGAREAQRKRREQMRRS